MRSFIDSLLGTYVPQTYEHFVTLTDGTQGLENVIPDGLAGVDWSYIIAGLVFVILIYSIFRTIGGLICKSL